LPARFTGDGALYECGLGSEQILLAQLVQRVSDQILACPGEYGEVSQVVLAVAMPPDAGSGRAQAMSGMAVSIVEEELLANRLFNQTVLTCSG
jgi:hypothetical protein